MDTIARAKLEDRMRKQSVRAENGCLEWRGLRTHKGYGRIRVGAKKERAHRVAWQLANGEIPRGFFVCHHCDNPPCIDPGHLFVGTNLDNVRDAMAKGRRRTRVPTFFGPKKPKPTKPPRTPRLNSMAKKLSAEKVVAAREAVARGASIRAMALDMGVGYAGLWSALVGASWGHVGGPLMGPGRIGRPRKETSRRAMVVARGPVF